MDRQQFIDWCLSYSKFQHEDMPLIMGVLNTTPNSFYDGGQYTTVDLAYERALNMITAGADLIDIGGESSQPGAVPITIGEELERVLPVIERIRAAHPTALTIDTCKPEVMRAAVDAGVACINDIYALQQPGALAVAAGCDVPICLMHMQGTPQTMQHHPHYSDSVITQVDAFFTQRLEVCRAAGIARNRVILDPGFGFGKTKQHNLQLVKHLATFRHHELPLLLGVSRKSTIGDILNQPPEGRLIGGLALAISAMLAGVAIIRTHDVMETKQAFQIIQHMRLSDRGK